MRKAMLLLILLACGYQSVLYSSDLSPKSPYRAFSDGTLVETSKVVFEESSGKTYFVEEGHVQISNDCRIRRTELVLNGLELRPLPPGITETCAGKDCSHCTFKPEGGCACDISYNMCEHTISRFQDTVGIPGLGNHSLPGK